MKWFWELWLDVPSCYTTAFYRYDKGNSKPWGCCSPCPYPMALSDHQILSSICPEKKKKKGLFSSSSSSPCLKFINTVTSNLNAKWCEMSYTKNNVLEMGQYWNICTLYKLVYYLLQFQALLTQFSSIPTRQGVKFWLILREIQTELSI